MSPKKLALKKDSFIAALENINKQHRPQTEKIINYPLFNYQLFLRA